MSDTTDHAETTRTANGGQQSLWRNRNFVQFFLGQLVTNVGDSLYTIAILWLVFDRTGSTFLTGVANSLLLLPWLLQIVAGPFIDRFSVKRVLVRAQFVQGVVVLALPAAAYTGYLSIGFILVVIPALSLMTLILAPVQSVLVPRIVRPDQLSRSNSALSTVTLGLDMIFEAVGGGLIAILGAMTLFVSDSLTFVVSGILFLRMVVSPPKDGNEESKETAKSGYVDDLREGIEVLRGTVFVDMVFTTAVSNFAVGVTLTILPAFGALHGGPIMYGVLLGALGVGRMIGSATASYFESVPFGRLTATTFTISAALWLASVYSPSRVLIVGLFAIAWISGGINDVMIATLNQKVFPEGLLGRVSAIKGTASGATLPIGSLIGGLIAERLGTVTTMGLAAFGFGFVGLYFALRSPLRTLPAIRDAKPADFDIGDPTNDGN